MNAVLPSGSHSPSSGFTPELPASTGRPARSPAPSGARRYRARSQWPPRLPGQRLCRRGQEVNRSCLTRHRRSACQQPLRNRRAAIGRSARRPPTPPLGWQWNFTKVESPWVRTRRKLCTSKPSTTRNGRSSVRSDRIHITLRIVSELSQMKSRNVSCAVAACGKPQFGSILAAWTKSGNFISWKPQLTASFRWVRAL